ncbi:MAG: Lrp/AsnC family transcriptional regulator [Dehalococcoidia bacterium]
MAKWISQFPEAHSAYLISGTYDLSIMVRGKSMQEISAFVAEKLAPLRQVKDLQNSFSRLE